MYQYYVLYFTWWWLNEPKHVAEFLILITNICCVYWLNKLLYELEQICKNEVVKTFNAMSWCLPGGTEGSHDPHPSPYGRYSSRTFEIGTSRCLDLYLLNQLDPSKFCSIVTNAEGPHNWRYTTSNTCQLEQYCLWNWRRINWYNLRTALKETTDAAFNMSGFKSCRSKSVRSVGKCLPIW